MSCSTSFAAACPFALADGLHTRSELRRHITEAYRLPEAIAIQQLLAPATLPADQAQHANALARQLAQQLRERKPGTGRSGLVQGLLQEYALSSQEGVALMCLAEALLRIPDTATRDRLIRDKIARGHWKAHTGRSPSMFVNAATWGLLLTGKLVASHSEASMSSLLTRLIAKGGEPMIRKGVDMAMRMMGEQFVTGETIGSALEHARALEAEGFRYSYDMLGEAAMTAEDAKRYLTSYEQAIHAIGKASNGRGVYAGPGISIKLSALHPRYSRAQYQRVMDELYPVVLGLATLSRQYNIGLNIDAEEADRLELSLDLLEKLCFEPALAGWEGIGFVIQAYQKRCPYVIDYVIDLARRSSHRLMIRLVKGAYWDSEIKRAQIDGQSDFPVYTRKVHTDVSYIACARKLLAAPTEIYPQFATHNAHTMATIYTLAQPQSYYPGQYEFQCLHGMGEPLYAQVVGDRGTGKLGRPCRIYAPVGTHETLLAYLVRRLLENGANTSFVNRVADTSLPIASLVEDPGVAVQRMALQEGSAGLPHPLIAHPQNLYGQARRNSEGLDLSNELTLHALHDKVAQSQQLPWFSGPVLANASHLPAGPTLPVRNPAQHADVVGSVEFASPAHMTAALETAAAYAPTWAQSEPQERAAALETAADLMQQRLPVLLGLLAREAGKTYANGIAEVREAIDFLRFYAAQARTDWDPHSHRPLGPVVCISPWNFPLAIFTGQVAAALAAGNPVLAKPAEQTPLIAAEAVRLMHEAGLPQQALQLIPGAGEAGAALVNSPHTQAVMFTGSTEVARTIQKSLSLRLSPAGLPIALVAETGGQNAMIVDSSALTEQVVADVLHSAFDSAGQRCSALRVLCVQEDSAPRLLHMLRGAVEELHVSNPSWLHTDVGPVIDAEAQSRIEQHIQHMAGQGLAVHRLGRHSAAELRNGTFVLPTLIELQHLSQLEHEVFGPVLHIVRYQRRDLPQLMDQINATGYGLTLGLHTRIDETIAQVTAGAQVGNLYVNRNMVGAVVGVQPFGGEGLSGTGPKAGGPLYMYRLLSQAPDNVVGHAMRQIAPHARASASRAVPAPYQSLLRWLDKQPDSALATACQRFAHSAQAMQTCTLNGPTGEHNTYSLHAREAALCCADNASDRLFQTAAALAAGSKVIWPATADSQQQHRQLPGDVQASIALATDWSAAGVHFDVVLHQGSEAALRQTAQKLALRPGAIVNLRRFDLQNNAAPFEALLTEKSLSVNTAAAGGNASLMTMA